MTFAHVIACEVDNLRIEPSDERLSLLHQERLLLVFVLEISVIMKFYFGN